MPSWAGLTNIKGPTGSTGSAGSTGSTGSAGADGKTVRNGSGAPSSGLGVDGDFYIDTTAHAVYGPKTSGAWGSATSLVGPSTGSAGGALAGTYPNPTLASGVTIASPAISAPTVSGLATFSDSIVNTPFVLTDAATIAIDASQSNHFRVTLGTTGHALGAPTNLTDGQKLFIEVIQDATGSRAFSTTWNAVYAFGTDIVAPVLSTAANKRDFIGFVYSNSKLNCIAFVRGY